MLNYCTDAHPGGTVFFLQKEQLGVHRTKHFLDRKMLLKVALKKCFAVCHLKLWLVEQLQGKDRLLFHEVCSAHTHTSSAEGLRWLEASRAGCR